MERKELGKYIVADPEICHGKPTFKGTRIMVWQVFDLFAMGEDWDSIANAWPSKIPREAIAEALQLARQVFESRGVVEHLEEHLPEPTSV